MTSGARHLVEILVPKSTGTGQSVGKDWFEALLKELTDKFGGVTSLGRPEMACGKAAAKSKAIPSPSGACITRGAIVMGVGECNRCTGFGRCSATEEPARFGSTSREIRTGSRGSNLRCVIASRANAASRAAST